MRSSEEDFSTREIADAPSETSASGSEQAKQGSSVNAIARAIRVMDVLAAAPEGAELLVIARAVGMSASGVHRVLRTLIDGGLVHQPGARGSYRLGPKVLVWAQSMRSEAALQAAAEPELAELHAAINDTVMLSLMRDRRIWTLIAMEGRSHLVVRPDQSELRYFHTSGRGKLFLAYLDRADARALIANTGLPAFTPHTITDEATLWTVVDEARRNGYATSREEAGLGGGGIAVPVHDTAGRLAACVAMSAPTVRLDQQRQAELLERLRQTAQRIERAWNREGAENE